MTFSMGDNGLATGLVVRGVGKSFVANGKEQTVLRGIDLTIPSQSFVSLIGHSGCGKSTLINIIGGLTNASMGSVRLDGRLVTSAGPDRAMVFQQYSLLPRLSVIDNVRVAVRAARPEWSNAHVDDRVERYVTAVGLWEHRAKRPAQISGGMQQRAAVARGFAVEPRVLLLDEPFGALDPLTRARLQGQLIELWTSGSDTEIVLMVTHGVDEAVVLSDRVVVMGNAPKPSILDDITINIPRPRRTPEVFDDPDFRAIHGRLLRLLGAEDEEAA
jgi:ABC-type nitrate/sulfonate/bicarbonate transport system ATPase subunit